MNKEKRKEEKKGEASAKKDKRGEERKKKEREESRRKKKKKCKVRERNIFLIDSRIKKYGVLFIIAHELYMTVYCAC